MGTRCGRHRIALLRARFSRMRDAKLLTQKYLVHLLQAAAGGLGVEEVGDGHKTGIEDRPDDIQAKPQIADRHRGDVDDDEVAQPVGADADGDALVAGAQGHDLAGVHPRDGQDAPGEDVEEQKARGDEDPVRDCGVDG